MRFKNRNSFKNLDRNRHMNRHASYQKFALFFILLVLISLFGVWLFWPVEKRDTTFNFINALNTGDTSYCEKMALLGPRQRCIAMVTNNAELCNVLDSLKNESCIAVVRKDVSLCGEDILCKTLVTGNPDECIKILTEGNYSESDKTLRTNRCIAYATKNPKLLSVKNIYRFNFLN